jgi:hypothetical protein
VASQRRKVWATSTSVVTWETANAVRETCSGKSPLPGNPTRDGGCHRNDVLLTRREDTLLRLRRLPVNDLAGTVLVVRLEFDRLAPGGAATA